MDISVLSFDEVKTLAKSVEGFKIHHKTGEDNYRTEFQAYINDNPGCLEDEPEEDIIPLPESLDKPEAKEIKESLVKIKSIHRGKIGSSVGEVDFGKDGIATMTVEQAEHFLKIPKGYEEC